MEQKYSNKIRFSICIYFSSSIFDTRRTCFFQSSWKFYILSPLFYISRAIYSDRRNGNSGYLIPRAPSLSIQGLLSPISRRFGTNLRSWSSPTSSVILSSMNSKVTCIQFLFEIQIYNRRHAKPFGNYKFKAIYENLRLPENEWVDIRHPNQPSEIRSIELDPRIHPVSPQNESSNWLNSFHKGEGRSKIVIRRSLATRSLVGNRDIIGLGGRNFGHGGSSTSVSWEACARSTRDNVSRAIYRLSKLGGKLALPRKE